MNGSSKSNTQPAVRWMAIYLPRLKTDRLRRSGRVSGEAAALCVYAKQANAHVLLEVDAHGARAGLTAGQSLSDARAIKPDLVAIEEEPAADACALHAIAEWCGRYSPVVIVDAPPSEPKGGLWLDLSGVAHLFDGEARLRNDIEARLKAQGFHAHAAIAPNPAAAWAFARFGGPYLVDQDDLHAALAPLPVAALRAPPEASALLKRLGLKTIGHVLDAPRAPFVARAGSQAMARLDAVLGRAREAFAPHRPAPPVFALRRFVEPLLYVEAVLIAAENALQSLVADLDMRGAGVRRLGTHLFALDGRTRTLTLGLSRPERDVSVLLRLLRERLNQHPEALDAEFGIEALRLDATEIAPIKLQITDLAPASGRDPAAEARLVDALVTRLGARRVGRLYVRDTHQPAQANGWATPNTREDAFLRQAQEGAGVSLSTASDGVMRRPLSLFDPAQPIEALAEVPDGPPLRFRWRRVLREVARAEGPERIAGDWLAAPAQKPRNYYRVEDKQGRRYWLYREGAYGESDAPRWYVHGLFA